MVDEQLEAKRKAANEDGAADAAKAMKVDAAMTLTEDFNPQLLRIYYDRLFPFTLMHRWLNYRHNSKTGPERDFFFRREFTFVLPGDVYCRYQCFRDAEAYKAAVQEQQPVRMEIGAVFTHPPKNHKMVVKEAYQPVERELVFDIDMDDYDDIRTCCTGAKLCAKCWTFMKAAIKTLRRALEDDFGFRHLLFVFSGRRGVHCWVGDKAARLLSNDQRSAVAEYLTVVAGGANKSRAEVKLQGCAEAHPSLLEAYKILEPYFRNDPNGVLLGQDILRKGNHFDRITSTFTIQERETIKKWMEAHPDATSREIWLQIEKVQDEREKAASTIKLKAEAKMMLKEVVLQYTYPRLDINVSKQMNHLLKSPFVVHPKTGRVCVPIDPDNVDEFDPLAVPTIGKLALELGPTSDARQTSLQKYIHFFETSFVKPLELALLKEGGDSGDLEW
mmetsp:Transcript_52105/g.124103  ORF Transcript_52105/g.124103 Transcript_52105/m.124103 type:complete len:445 (+) Transcript_52105:72-1406(+)|eukprot:CAMPEP_0178405576 /NCGR_PEP_ID=MMETSP0689_2-20121128/18471_1 /TAXON_ID=160604 /ORGANISM="Amphidinium massartii, Strain CS-259" /LENGTH=444 /DNA_ID=CAMNT_0020026597 /DNA_START=72 /DNA_END=1406 /DNA_ORIENTATION=-